MTDKVLPKRTLRNTEKYEPIRTKDRIDIELASRMKSSTEIADPNFTNP
jgi:hypothetical protein